MPAHGLDAQETPANRNPPATLKWHPRPLKSATRHDFDAVAFDPPSVGAAAFHLLLQSKDRERKETHDVAVMHFWGKWSGW